MQSAPVATYMAINGAGFFAVQKPGSFTDNNPIFTGVNNYTRAGDFSLDKNGYLVNGAGYYLEGVPIDSTTGNPVGSIPQVLKFQNDFLPSQATTKIDYRANLASYPLTTKHDTSVPGSELLRPADFGTNPQVSGTQPPVFSDNFKTGIQVNNKASSPGRSPALRCSPVRTLPTRSPPRTSPPATPSSSAPASATPSRPSRSTIPAPPPPPPVDLASRRST